MSTSKINVCTRIPKKLKEWADKEIDEGYYGNMGELLRMALFAYKNTLEKERHEGKRQKERIIEILRNDPELLEEVLRTAMKAIEEEKNAKRIAEILVSDPKLKEQAFLAFKKGE